MKLKTLLKSAICAVPVLGLFSMPVSFAGTASVPEETHKLIALTFDDGPNTTTTNEILDILEEYHAVASFFLIGDHINEESAVTVKRAYDMGCEIDNHSRTHSNMPDMTAEEIAAEIAYVDAYVYEITGEVTKFFRPPYIAVNQTMYDAIEKPFICGVGCNDFMEEVTAQERADAVISAAKDGLIVLLHDAKGNSQTVEALKAIIPTLQADGYEFVTLTELFERQGEVPRDTQLYSEVTKYPCADYTVFRTIFSGEATGDTKWSEWGKIAVLDGAELAALGDTYAIEVDYEGMYQPVIALQQWSGTSLFCSVQPRYYNGAKACFFAEDIQKALEENNTDYTSLNRISVIPYGGTMTMTNTSLLVKKSSGDSLPGDVNADGTVSVADAVMMQKYLLHAGTLTDWKAGDLYTDDAINGLDLCLLKRMLLA